MRRKTGAEVFIDSMKEETLETPKEENNEPPKEETKKTTNVEKKIERKRVSFDLRTDLHKKFKMLSIEEDENIYILIERAMERFLEERKE